MYILFYSAAKVQCTRLTLIFLIVDEWMVKISFVYLNNFTLNYLYFTHARALKKHVVSLTYIEI